MKEIHAIGLIQVTELTESYIMNNFISDSLYKFSQYLDELESLYVYLISWLSNKYFKSTHGNIIGDYINNTLYFQNTDYEIKLYNNPEFIKNINYSTINYNIQLLNLGTTKSYIEKQLLHKFQDLRSFLPRIDDISVESIVQDKNTLYIYIYTTYNGEVEKLEFNIKIYQEYE